MQRELIVTKDGSHSIAIPAMQVTYHSIHGAIAESNHVYIEAGLKYFLKSCSHDQLNIFEIGFGTGLNALLTLINTKDKAINIYYEAIETHPLNDQEASTLNYSDQLGKVYKETLHLLHASSWEQEARLSDSFILCKKKISLEEYIPLKKFNLVYFDAFAPSAQPELWTKEIFQKIFSLMEANGIMVTYCAKGEVRRALAATGFSVEKLKGAPGKREMIRAVR